jgi:hypothetical protein
MGGTTMEKKINWLINIAIMLFMINTVCSCKTTQYVPIKEVHTDVRFVDKHDTVISNQRTVSVDVPLPIVKLQNITKDTVSVLTDGLYRSVASVKDGILSHMLETIPSAKLKSNVQVQDTTKIHNNSTKESRVDSIPVPYPVYKYIDKELSWWQTLVMDMGYVFIGAILLAIVYLIVKLGREV